MRPSHAGEISMQALAKQRLLKATMTCNIDFYEYCVLSKKTKVKFGTAIYRTKIILDYLHTNIWGLSKNASLGEKHYFISFIDDYSGRNWVYTVS